MDFGSCEENKRLWNNASNKLSFGSSNDRVRIDFLNAFETVTRILFDWLLRDLYSGMEEEVDRGINTSSKNCMRQADLYF